MARDPEPASGVPLRIAGRRALWALVDADLLDDLSRGPAWCDWPSWRNTEGQPVPARNAWRTKAGELLTDPRRYKKGARRIETIAGVVAGVRRGQHVRHKNGDTLDCRRANLVVVEGKIGLASGNAFGGERLRYEVQHWIRGVRYHCGSWHTLEIAAYAAGQCAEIKARAEAEGWKPHEVRRAVDLAIGRKRRRRRRPKIETAAADAAYQEPTRKETKR